MLIQKDNLDMLVRHKVYTESELRSRYDHRCGAALGL